MQSFKQIRHRPYSLAVLSIVLILLIAGLGGTLSAKITDSEAPYLVILGVVQDASFPQAGCYQRHCLPAWQDPRKRRGAVSLGVVDPSAKAKYLFEATPDFPEQLYQLDQLAPNSDFKLNGIFLTHAHIGHYAGLMYLGKESMNASSVPVYVMPRMHEYLASNGPWSQLVELDNIRLQRLADQKTVASGNLKFTPLIVPHRDEFSETVAYFIQGPSKTALFIPDINKWSAWATDIANLVKSVDYALLDATFFADGELGNRDMSKIPHPFVSESMEALKELSMQDRNKVWFIHLNHTNPLLNKNSEQSKFVRSEGFNIASEGIQLEL